MEKKKPKETKKERIKSNPKVDEIVKDFPEQIHAFPRSSFEEQLKNHLLKHKVK